MISGAFTRIIENVLTVDGYNGRATAWHIYGALYDNGIFCLDFPQQLLAEVSKKAFEGLTNFPPFRRSLFIDDFLSFAGCVGLSLEGVHSVVTFMLSDQIQGIFYHYNGTGMREKLQKILMKDEALLLQLLDELNTFSRSLLDTLVVERQANQINFWLFKFLKTVGFADKSEAKAKFELAEQGLLEGLHRVFEELERMNNNPYVKVTEYSTLSITNMRSAFEYLSVYPTALATPAYLQTIVKAYINLSDHFLDQREAIESSLHSLTRHSDLSNFQTMEALTKQLAACTTALTSHLQPAPKEEEQGLQLRSYKAEILAVAFNQLAFTVIEQGREAELSEGLRELMVLLHSKLAGFRAFRIPPLSKATTLVCIEYFNQALLMTEERIQEHIVDWSLISLATKESKRSINKIFSQCILPKMSTQSPASNKFFAVLIDNIAKNRNSLTAQHMFEGFLIVSLDSLDEERTKLLSAKMIEVCEIENSAFKLRQIAVLACRYILTRPQSINQIRDLIHYLVLKEVSPSNQGTAPQRLRPGRRHP